MRNQLPADSSTGRELFKDKLGECCDFIGVQLENGLCDIARCLAENSSLQTCDIVQIQFTIRGSVQPFVTVLVLEQESLVIASKYQSAGFA